MCNQASSSWRSRCWGEPVRPTLSLTRPWEMPVVVGADQESKGGSRLKQAGAPGQAAVGGTVGSLHPSAGRDPGVSIRHADQHASPGFTRGSPGAVPSQGLITQALSTASHPVRHSRETLPSTPTPPVHTACPPTHPKPLGLTCRRQLRLAQLAAGGRGAGRHQGVKIAQGHGHEPCASGGGGAVCRGWELGMTRQTGTAVSKHRAPSCLGTLPLRVPVQPGAPPAPRAHQSRSCSAAAP